MSNAVDFHDVSTVALESSPVAIALAGASTDRGCGYGPSR